MSARRLELAEAVAGRRRWLAMVSTVLLSSAPLVVPAHLAYSSATVEFSLSDPQVVVSDVNDASVKTESFDALSAGALSASGSLAVGTFTTDGATVSAPSSGSTDWGGTGTNYLIVGSSKTLEITLAEPSRYVGFFWGGGDPENEVELYGDVDGSDVLLGTFTTDTIEKLVGREGGDYWVECIQSVIQANRCGNANYAYVNLQLIDSNATFTKIKFIQGSSGGFEIDNLTTSTAQVNLGKGTQEITWTPTTTSLTLADSGLILDATLTTGNGTLAYEVVSAGTTGCTISGSTLTFSSPGSCEIRPTATSTLEFNAKTDAATVTFSIAQGTFAITSPSSRVGVTSSSFTDVCDSSCQVSGFAPSDQIRVVVSNSDGTALSGRVRVGSTTGLTQGQPGYQTDATDSDGHQELAFVGTQAQVNAALATLQYRAPAAGGDETVGISATLSGAAYFAGTGNYYEYVSGTLTWTQAKAAAATRTFNGFTGYLATITSEEENVFVVEKTGGAAAWIGGSDEYTEINTATGGTLSNQTASEGEWYWVTGPEAGTKFWDNNLAERRISDGNDGFLYQNWDNSVNGAGGSEPSNSLSSEHFVQLLVGGTGLWNDLPNSPTTGLGYVVEYGGVTGQTVLKEAFTSVVVGAPTAPDRVTGLSVTAGNGQLILSWTAPDTGGSDITDYVIEQLDPDTSTWNVIIDGLSPATTRTIFGLTNGTEYSFRVAAVNDIGTGDASESASGTPVAPPPASNPSRPRPQQDNSVTSPNTTTGGTSPVLPPSRTTPTPGTPPAPLAGPLPGATGGNGTVLNQPAALVGGREVPVSTQVVGQNQVNLQTGTANFGLQVPNGQGSVSSGPNGSTELGVQSGGSTSFSGSGLFPGSTVQIFMPLGGHQSREIGQLPVDQTGSFQGDAVFGSGPGEQPLPIGRQVLQIASVNEAGERVIVEMAINIAQPAPTPQTLLDDGTIPEMGPGQSFATQAGVPVNVTLTVSPGTGQTTIEGDGWGFIVNLNEDGSSVEETPDGGAMMSLVRGGTATISGNGFMPLSRADIWLFSDPTLLTTVDIDENGEFTGEISVDGRVIPIGDHTLQMQGVGTDGYILAANLGVAVTDPETESATPTAQASSGVLWWVGGILAALLLVVLAWWVLRRRRDVV